MFKAKGGRDKVIVVLNYGFLIYFIKSRKIRNEEKEISNWFGNLFSSYYYINFILSYKSE